MVTLLKLASAREKSAQYKLVASYYKLNDAYYHSNHDDYDDDHWRLNKSWHATQLPRVVVEVNSL